MFTKEEKEMIIVGLQLRRNYIESDCVNLSLADLDNMGQEAFQHCGGRIKGLSLTQMQLCIDTEKLITKITNS